MNTFKKAVVLSAIAAVISFPAFAEEGKNNQPQTPHHPSHQTAPNEAHPSDAVKKELKDYHAKKKELRENLSPEAKDHLKKRHEKRKNMRKDKREDRREDRKERRHDKYKDHMNNNNEHGGSEQGGQY